MAITTRATESKNAGKGNDDSNSSDSDHPSNKVVNLKRDNLGSKPSVPSPYPASSVSLPQSKEGKTIVDKSSGYLTAIAVIFGIIAVVTAALIFYNPQLLEQNNIINDDVETPTEIFTRLLPVFQEHFPNIPEISLRTINYTILSVLDHKDPRSPAAILILGTEGRKSYTEKIMQFLMDILSQTFNKKINQEVQYLNFEKEDPSDPSELKLKISNKIALAFKKHSFLSIQNIDKAPWNVVSILHPYFDHENAPHTRVVYLCSATTNAKLSDVSLKGFRILAESHFDTAWEKYHRDHRDAMYSRMFTGLAVV